MAWCKLLQTSLKQFIELWKENFLVNYAIANKAATTNFLLYRPPLLATDKIFLLINCVWKSAENWAEKIDFLFSFRQNHHFHWKLQNTWKNDEIFEENSCLPPCKLGACLLSKSWSKYLKRVTCAMLFVFIIKIFVYFLILNLSMTHLALAFLSNFKLHNGNFSFK